jgi:hypothetical protein
MDKKSNVNVRISRKRCLVIDKVHFAQRNTQSAISPGVKRPKREADNHLHLAPGSGMVKQQLLSPTCLNGRVLNYLSTGYFYLTLFYIPSTTRRN